MSHSLSSLPSLTLFFSFSLKASRKLEDSKNSNATVIAISTPLLRPCLYYPLQRFPFAHVSTPYPAYFPSTQFTSYLHQPNPLSYLLLIHTTTRSLSFMKEKGREEINNEGIVGVGNKEVEERKGKEENNMEVEAEAEIAEVFETMEKEAKGGGFGKESIKGLKLRFLG